MERFRINDDGEVRDSWSRLDYTLMKLPIQYDKYKYTPGFLPVFERDGFDTVTYQTSLKPLKTRYDEEELKEKLLPLLYGLSKLHEDGVVYGNLTPKCIQDSDFGFVLTVAGEGEEITEKNDYSAPEFYGFKDIGLQCSDVYSLSMIVYELLSGELLPAVPKRKKQPEYDPLYVLDISDEISDAIDGGLKLTSLERTQNFTELLNAMYTEER